MPDTKTLQFKKILFEKKSSPLWMTQTKFIFAPLMEIGEKSLLRFDISGKKGSRVPPTCEVLSIVVEKAVGTLQIEAEPSVSCRSQIPELSLK